MKNAIVIMLLAVSVATTYLFWYLPATQMAYKPTMLYEIPREMPGPEKGTPRHEAVPQPSPGPSKHDKLKKELKDWLDIGGKAIPIISFGGALWLKRKGKKRR